MQSEVSSSEFSEWVRFFELRRKECGPEHLYLAQIAAEVCRSSAADPRAIKTEDFLLDMHAPPRRPQTQEELARTFKAWFAMLKAAGAPRRQ